MSADGERRRTEVNGLCGTEKHAFGNRYGLAAEVRRERSAIDADGQTRRG